MKALSLWQPWASLWCSPRKRHETRGAGSHFDRAYRGWLAVHATKKFIRDFAADDPLRAVLVDEFGANWETALPTGAIIGAVHVVAVTPTDLLCDTAPVDREDNICGDFSRGRFAIERDRFVVLDEPISFRGQQGRYFDIPDFPALTSLLQEPRDG